jgi:GMP synthase (glutamine-hydrolysing)
VKIGILETGYRPEETIEEHGNYPQAFMELLDGFGFSFESWAALEGELPDNVNSADGWLLTGSKYGAYEDLPWIKPLEQFLSTAYENNVPIVGICFGHQILAQALGGKVEKFSGGWSVGRVNYQLDDAEQPVPLYAWHQDQVVELPADATVVGSTDFCRYAALQYGNKAYTIQPHPEFTEGYINDLLTARKDVLPTNIIEQAVDSIAGGDTNPRIIADKIAGFFLNSRRNA